MMTWPPPETMISPFVSPFILLLLPHDVLGHPNGAVPTPFLLPNLVSNHLAICFLLNHIDGAIALVPPVGLGVDERTLDC